MSIQRLAMTVFAVVIVPCVVAQTSTTFTRTLTFPPVGLGSTETAEVNVVNVASNSSNGTAASCAGSISFLNASGTTIASATTQFTVTSGQIFSAHLPFANSGGTAPRTAIRGSAQLTSPTGNPHPPCDLQVSMATYDTSTGATHVVLTGLEVSLPIGPGFR